MATTMDRPHREPVHPTPRGTGPWPVAFYRSAVGKKWVMAVTGLMIIGFVFAHAVGNLKVYLGAEDFNHYGEFLRELLVPILPRTVALWLLRIGLIVAFVFHIHAAYGAHPHEPPGQRPRLRAAPRLPGRQRRQPLDALDRHHRRPLHPLPPRRPHLGHRQPRLRARRRLPELRRHLQPARPVAIIYIVANLALGHPPLPRRLVDVPEPRR